MTKPFSFGVNVRSAESAREWAHTARRVEELGYSPGSRKPSRSSSDSSAASV